MTTAPVDDELDIDEAAVIRAMDGDKSLPLNTDEVRVVVERLAAKGLRNAEIGARLGVSDSLVQSWRAGTRSWPLSLPANRGTTTTGTASSASRPVPAPPTRPTPPVVDGATAAPGSAEPTLDALVTAAARSTSKRTQALGVKLADLASVIRDRLRAERQSAEKAEQERAVREAAAAEVARLEAELREARAKLHPSRRGGIPPCRLTRRRRSGRSSTSN